ncbi:hypothetical protein HPB50_009910 [Hyalomma asiaticum]|uniref:Uncharacterized protein n=1 Tax=Hyalomma asiaticum TaxID=266040 RepID=A0ACB7SV41_HYAAI|nr:hypothetical protein HPB50_009910 [Hyalomma asiaticum]
MELHERSVDKFSCHECGKLFLKKKYLLEHERWHTTEMPYACHLCPAKFRRKYYMEVHVRGHTGEKPYKCEECEQSFTQLHSRKRHMHRVHRDAKLKDSSDMDGTQQTRSAETSRDEAIRDGESGTTDGSIKAPMKKHSSTVSRKYKCSMCGQRFTAGSSLQQHKILHTGKRPFACSTCSQKFSQKAGLLLHQRYHTEDIPYACELCPAKFCRKLSLKNHQQLHVSGVEFHQCLTCCHVFKSSTALEEHRGWHDRQKPHQCHLCPSSFMRKHALNSHILTHVLRDSTEKPRHACPLCSRRYAQQTSLQIHMRQAHSGVETNAARANDRERTVLLSSLPSMAPPVIIRKKEKQFFQVPANIDIKEEPRSPTTTLLPDMTCRDIKEEAVMRSSPPPLLSLVMESVDIKMEPSSPATTPPPKLRDSPFQDICCDDIKEETTMPSSPTPSSDMSCGDIKEETTPNSPTPSSHPLDVARTSQTSSTETSRDATVVDSEPGIPSGTSRAPVEKCRSGAGSSSHVCDVCGRSLSTKATLKRHHLSHTGERPYACSTCDRRFALKSNLRVHERTHAKDGSNTCKLCPFKANSQLMLARHYRFHKCGLKLHQCLQCDKLFKSGTILEEHQKQHNNKRRPYSCHVCPSSFMVKSQLDNHMLIHVQDDQTPHSCPVCKKCFSWWPSLITHMGQEHGDIENRVAVAENRPQKSVT